MPAHTGLIQQQAEACESDQNRPSEAGQDMPLSGAAIQGLASVTKRIQYYTRIKRLNTMCCPAHRRRDVRRVGERDGGNAGHQLRQRLGSRQQMRPIQEADMPVFSAMMSP